MKTVLIIYSGQTPTGSTATLAQWLKQGASSVQNIQAVVKEASAVTLEDVAGADGLLVGSGDYNGNPEPSMLEFIDNVLKAGSKNQLAKLHTMPLGVFATSGGYATGAQEVMTSIARAFMTFGVMYIGGDRWQWGQGVAGMTEKAPNGGWQWTDLDGLQKYLKEDACSYGRKVALAASTIPDAMATADTKNPNVCVSAPPKPKPPSPKPTPSSNVPTRSNGAVIGTGVGLSILLVLLLGLAYYYWIRPNPSKVPARTWGILGLSLLLYILAFVVIMVTLSSGASSTTPPGPTPPGPTPPGPTPPGPTPPGPHTFAGISAPQDPSSDMGLVLQDYVKQNYPLTSQYHKDFWKSLDFFWNMNCAQNQFNLNVGGSGYIPDTNTMQANKLLRTIVSGFQGLVKLAPGSQRWLAYSPAVLNTIKDDTAGFTYSQNKSGPSMHFEQGTALYDFVLFPLCSFMMPSGTASKLEGLMVNRYPPGSDRVNAVSYALSDTANKIVKSAVLPGVDQIHLNEGFKNNSLIEIAHCDTHMTELPTDGQTFNTCDLLASKCAGHGPPGMGNGKWVYYARGSGIWTNLGKTVVFRNKVHAILECINLWDGKDQRDAGNYVDTKYQGSLKGKFDYTKIGDWQTFVLDKDGMVRTALQSILTAACLCPAGQTCNEVPNTGKYPGKPSTAHVHGFGDSQSNNGCDQDPLGLGDTSLYTGPCTTQYQAGYCNTNAASNDIPMWWFHAPDLTTTSQWNWGALSPLAPQQMKSQSEKLGWLLWACVNGYDFSKNPNNYTWAQQVKDKFTSSAGSIQANNLLSTMSNSGYATDDVLIGYANYAMLDSVQLTTSSIEGNMTGFEVLLFTGSIDPNQSNKTGWICDSVNPKANMECKTGDSSESSLWLGGKQSAFLNIDPTDSKGKQITCVPALNDSSNGYFLQCKETNINYGDPYGFPLSSDKTPIVSKCGTPQPVPSPGKRCSDCQVCNNWKDGCSNAQDKTQGCYVLDSDESKCTKNLNGLGYTCSDTCPCYAPCGTTNPN
jgi:hypothetical protein